MKNAFCTDSKELERVAEVVRALAHPIRLQIVRQIIKKKSLQPTISQYLGKLKLHTVVACE